MECSFCKKEIKEKLGFKNVFSKKESFILCESCKINLYRTVRRIYLVLFR